MRKRWMIKVGVVMACALFCARAQAQPSPQGWTLQAARERAVTHNLDVILARLQRQVQSLEGEVALRPFVPVVSLSAGYEDDPGLGLVGPRVRGLRYGAGVEWTSLWGSSVAAN